MTDTRILLGVWGLLLVSGLASAALFGQGVLRDSRHGEPVVRLDLSKETDWMAAPFRVWREGRHRLLLSSVNHDDRLVGRPFRGEIEVRIVDPNGTVVLERGYPPGSTEHVVPSNYGDVRLDSIRIHGGSFGRWALRVRVTDGDAGFETVRSEVKLRTDRRDLGMGGLINTVMILPAGLLLVLATLVAVPLARRNHRSPLVLTLSLLLAFTLFVTWRPG
jgi:hypothetical protein